MPVFFLLEHLELAGTVTASLMLSRLVYAYGHGQKGWFIRSDYDWEEDAGLTEKQVRLARQRLVKRGLVKARVRFHAGRKSVWYLLEHDRYIEGMRPIAKRNADERADTILRNAECAATGA